MVTHLLFVWYGIQYSYKNIANMTANLDLQSPDFYHHIMHVILDVRAALFSIIPPIFIYVVIEREIMIEIARIRWGGHKLEMP